MKKMPVVFIGHGSPMNAIEENEYTRGWSDIAARIPTPEAILVISAHWSVHGTRISDDPNPKTIYDMYGFPQELYNLQYSPAGAPALAHVTKELVGNAQIDNSWGVDHGTWSILTKMYPNADIPVFQMSVNQDLNAYEHFEIGKKLRLLREKGVLIFGSGNVVHNLARVNWNMDGGYDWAVEFDNYIKDKIVKKEYKDVIDYQKAGVIAELSFMTSEHFDPLLYVLGASEDADKLSILNNSCTLGALSMTSYLFES
ncbi:MAG: 4,5-DOPA dioxygenase extradiol [Bacillota bacterium]|nr:4,5-DOPA dioxygenase extradiol [Bacillota bacterium]